MQTLPLHHRVGSPLRRPQGVASPCLCSPPFLVNSHFIIIEQKRIANCDFFHGVGREMDAFIL